MSPPEAPRAPQKPRTPPPTPEDPTPGKSATTPYRPWFLYLSMAMMVLWFWQALFSNVEAQSIPYSDFKRHIAAGEVVEVAIGDDQISGLIMPGGKDKLPAQPARPGVGAATRAHGERQPWYAPFLPPGLQPKADKDGAATAPDSQPWTFHTTRVEDPQLVPELEAAGVRITGVRPSPLAQVFWSWVLPLLFFFMLWSVLSRRFSAVGSSVLGFGKSRAKLSTEKNTGKTFADVAGCDEAKHELVEVVNFLKAPERYQALGAKIPKGVLLVGPPGTGKTLLARAVAGEAGVPFFSISGSDFVEMFVGVGAARVRDLFEQAKKQQPCIIFIDEVDTIGRHRGVHMGMTNDEREQTLNQLLNEMDGFEPNAGIILLAATNRPEVLDRALLRPGRFDRQVVIDAPDVRGREEILRVHGRDKPLAADVDLAKIARGTPGFSGADLANTMNEAALLATRRERRQITQLDLEDAIEKVVAGPERRSRRLGEAEKRRVAFHESGHALVATFCEHADPVHKISIVPRGRAALGYTLQLPEGEQYLLTRSELMDRIKGLLGGRAAEELVFGEVSTGAENDLDKATALARQMVTMYGMGDKVGLAHVGQRQRALHLVAPGEEGVAADCSQETAREIDEEVKAILDEAYSGAQSLLTAHQSQLERVANTLLTRETIDGAELKALLEMQGGTSGGGLRASREQ